MKGNSRSAGVSRKSHEASEVLIILIAWVGGWHYVCRPTHVECRNSDNYLMIIIK